MALSDLNLVAAAELLTSSEPATRPYDVPLSELVEVTELVRPSSMMTLPLDLGDLPDDAYPTELLLVTVAEP